ncbi:DMT family transporter [Shewanella sp. AS16]|uniref:DMT family transporter n=1 Tax=Shewanella sp. AS16 TaxID=2907625 RepID=UPI001F1F336F|nr:DMT family transporter [Shewanella sp. AS16]MCE9687959.1 DMT family transporter [Shewanella sp. AS16]
MTASMQSRFKLFGLTLVTLLAFAGNSLLCRQALAHTGMDAASFTSVRLLSGTLALLLICRVTSRPYRGQGNWISAAALFGYAAGFSFAYLALPAGVGALLLFGAVQTSMIGYGCWRGERLAAVQWLGLLLAFAGLLGLLLPGAAAAPLPASLLMLFAGASWGLYSLRGHSAANPATGAANGSGKAISLTAGNFLRTLPFTLVLSASVLLASAFDMGRLSMPPAGLAYAVASGALASGVGYAIWYSVLPYLKAAQAATVQLSVPVLAAFGGVLLLDEHVSLRLLLASVAILGGVALVLLEAKPKPEPKAGPGS